MLYPLSYGGWARSSLAGNGRPYPARVAGAVRYVGVGVGDDAVPR